MRLLLAISTTGEVRPKHTFIVGACSRFNCLHLNACIALDIQILTLQCLPYFYTYFSVLIAYIYVTFLTFNTYFLHAYNPYI